jgi:hypothetical protein
MVDDPSKRLWYRLTPHRFVIGLLIVECLLWLSKSALWLDKGWAVLIAIASVGVAVLLMLFWFAASLIFHRRFQFSIRSLLVLMLAVAIPCGWLAVEKERAKQQSNAVEEIKKLGGVVRYYWDIGYGGPYLPNAQPPGPTWLRNMLGVYFFADIRWVIFNDRQITDAGLDRLKSMTGLQMLWLINIKFTDAGLEHLQGLTQLQYLRLDYTQVTGVGLKNLKGLTHLRFLCLANSQVTDQGLEQAKGLTQLQELILDGTQVTDTGVKKLQQALPNCWISH